MNTSSTPSPDDLLWVRRQWNNMWRAAYKLSDVDGFHWSEFSGGIQQRANRPYVHAYVWCDDAVEGEVAHSCRHGDGPHKIKVCVTAVDNGGTRSAMTRHVRALADKRVGGAR